jgi:hypothetical protein
MSKLSQTIKKEVAELIPPTIYFFVALSIIAVIRLLMLEGTGLPISTPLQIALGAIIMGKAVLLADMIPFINRYPSKPLIYNVAWKTTIYVLVATAIHYVERLIHFWRGTGGFATANQDLFDKIIWSHYWAVEVIIAILVVNYCTFTELARVLGADNVRAIFFRRPPKEIVLAGPAMP